MKTVEAVVMTDDVQIVRRFRLYWHFVGWSCFSLGFHIDVAMPNVEVHLPLGFIRCGWCETAERNGKRVF